MTIHDDARAAGQAAGDAVYDAAFADLKRTIAERDRTISAQVVTAENLNRLTLEAQTDRDTALTAASVAKQTVTERDALIEQLRTRVRELEAAAPAPVRPTGPGFVAFESLKPQASMTATTAQAPKGSQITFAPGTFEIGDFTMYGDVNKKPGGYGLAWYLTRGRMGVRGSGIDKTIFRQKPGVSTRKDQVPPNAPAGTVNYEKAGLNLLFLMRLGNGDGPIIASDFTLEGTDQGHELNGITLFEAPDSIIERIKILGIRGSHGANPGETYGLAIQQNSHRTIVRNVEVDGRLNGVPVSGSNMTVTGCTGVLLEDVNTHHSGHGGPVVLYAATDTTMRRVRMADSGGEVSLNVERQAGFLRVEKCDFGSGGSRAHMMLQSDTTSSVVHIIDPIFTGPKFKLRAGGTYWGNPSKQNVADIHLIINGVERRDLLTIS